MNFKFPRGQSSHLLAHARLTWEVTLRILHIIKEIFSVLPATPFLHKGRFKQHTNCMQLKNQLSLTTAQQSYHCVLPALQSTPLEDTWSALFVLWWVSSSEISSHPVLSQIQLPVQTLYGCRGRPLTALWGTIHGALRTKFVSPWTASFGCWLLEGSKPLLKWTKIAQRIYSARSYHFMVA